MKTTIKYSGAEVKAHPGVMSSTNEEAVCLTISLPAAVIRDTALSSLTVSEKTHPEPTVGEIGDVVRAAVVALLLQKTIVAAVEIDLADFRKLVDEQVKNGYIKNSRP